MDNDKITNADELLVDSWLDGLSQTIASRLSDKELDRRLARVTRRQPRLIDRLSSAVERWSFRAGWRRRARSEMSALRQLDQALRGDARPTMPSGMPPIEQIAHDLRRLDRQRRTQPTTLSQRWREAVLTAYDERLMLACRILGVSEHLSPLDGMDREIERVRVEARLQESGVRVGYEV